jgi:hypothetical protein
MWCTKCNTFHTHNCPEEDNTPSYFNPPLTFNLSGDNDNDDKPYLRKSFLNININNDDDDKPAYPNLYPAINLDNDNDDKPYLRKSFLNININNDDDDKPAYPNLYQNLTLNNDDDKPIFRNPTFNFNNSTSELPKLKKPEIFFCGEMGCPGHEGPFGGRCLPRAGPGLGLGPPGGLTW